MGRIQSNIGLITGVPIEETVNQLMQLSALPRNRLAARNTELGREQAALTSLTTLVIGVQLTTDRLGQLSLFSSRAVASNKPETISARSVGSPQQGSYSFIPIRQAQSQQLTSNLFSSTDQKLQDGQLKIYTGGFLDQSIALDQLNEGGGVARGFIRITNRSGASRDVDLRFAQTASDVISAINGVDSLGVVASVDQGRFVLTDVSGGSVSDLRVQEVGQGMTARDLGLAAGTAVGNTLTGNSIHRLSSSTSLSNLLDGRGLEIPAQGVSLRFALADGSIVDIPGDSGSSISTLGQWLGQINAAGDGKLSAQISADGRRLEFKDLTAGSNPLSVTSPKGNLAEQLGLSYDAVSGEILSDQLLAGMNDTLLSSLRGGRGMGSLGMISITDRQGNSDAIDLSSAQTLQDVIQGINGGAINGSFRAQLNQTRTGIEIIDTSGGTGSFIIQNGDASDTARRLGLLYETTASSVDSGSLSRQTVGRQTSIAQFLNDANLSQSSFRLTDSQGVSATFNVATRKPDTVGDVIDGINQLGIGINARLNESGDGILLVDTAGGGSGMTVQDLGGGTAAAQLRISGSAKELTVDGDTVRGIDGTRNLTISTNADMTLADLAKSLNDMSLGPVSANLIQVGGSGVRLLLNGRSTGSQSRIAIQSSSGIAFSQTAEARDALLAFGASESTGGVLVSSPSDRFNNVIEGLELTVRSTSTTPVTITVSENQDGLTRQVETFVEQFNKLREKYDELTAFNPDSNEVGLLFGSNAALRLEIGYTRLFTAPIRSGAAAVRSLPELGISLNERGRLTFNRQQFERALADNPEAVKDFFTNETNGFSKRAKQVADGLAAVQGGSLLTRNNSLQQNIEQNATRIAAMDLRLERERNRLLQQFFGMEQAIARLQKNLTAINQLQVVPPMTSRAGGGR